MVVFGFVADLLFSNIESGLKNIPIRRMRVDGSRIRKKKLWIKKYQDSWTAPHWTMRENWETQSRREYIVAKSQVGRSGNAWKRSQRNHSNLYDFISRRNAPTNGHGNGKSTYSPVHEKDLKKNAETGVQYVVTELSVTN